MVIVGLYFWCVEVCVSKHQLIIKYSNFTITPSKCFEENQEICFYYHHQAHLIYYFGQDQIPVVMHMIQYRSGLDFDIL